MMEVQVFFLCRVYLRRVPCCFSGAAIACRTDIIFTNKINNDLMKHVFCIALLTIAVAGFAQDKDKTRLKLWYDEPAGEVWENALLVGNGRLGAMVYGNVEQETIQLNEHTVWSGGPNRNDNPDALEALPEIRKLIFEGKQKEAEILAGKTIQTNKASGQMFQPVGSLNLHFADHDDYTRYYRELDIERAVAKTSYVVDGVTYTREVISSFPDQVIAVHLTADKPNSLSFKASFLPHSRNPTSEPRLRRNWFFPEPPWITKG